MIRILTHFCTIVILSTCYGLYAQQPSFDNLQSLAGTQYHRIEYKPLDQVYHIYVKLPDEYDVAKKYPTIYLLDGGATFPMLAGYYRYLHFAGEVAELIIVGISYGTNDWQKGNMRSRDFTAKSVEREFWGGADNYKTFLTDELIPLIEINYSSDASKRIIFGQSLGGQFVLYAAQTSTQLFWGYIASNPALHRNLNLYLDMEPSIQENNDNSRLFVSSGSEDFPEFREPAIKWMKHWGAKEILPWKLKTETLVGHSHFSALPAAFREGLRWLFSEE